MGANNSTRRRMWRVDQEANHAAFLSSAILRPKDPEIPLEPSRISTSCLASRSRFLISSAERNPTGRWTSSAVKASTWVRLIIDLGGVQS